MQKASKREIKESKHKLKKSLGQNFLSDKNVVNKIIKTADVDKDTYVIEIGPGIGALTQDLIQLSKHVTAVEIDRELIPKLQASFGQFDNFEVINEDFLKIENEQLDKFENTKVKVVANLPYYITTAIITKIMLEMDFVDEIYVMVQKEVAERITASNKSRQYGSLSVFCQTVADVKYEFTVKKTVFVPVPKVDSAIISLKRKDITVNIAEFDKFIQNCFRQKRKILVNNLNAAYGLEKAVIIEFLASLNYNQSIRAEEISVEQFHELYEAFFKEFK